MFHPFGGKIVRDADNGSVRADLNTITDLGVLDV
jgi:hypothetical protein